MLPDWCHPSPPPPPPRLPSTLRRSLGAGAAALVSLKLHEIYPGLKCIAYSCPGGLVSKNLAHAMADWCTAVVVGKDAVPRMSVPNLGRLMDEMVTSLARCRQPKLKVLLLPWWRRHKADFRHLFWDYGEIPPEPLAVLERYHASRTAMGQPLAMFPPGRLIFLRPIKTRRKREWDAVWIRSGGRGRWGGGGFAVQLALDLMLPLHQPPMRGSGWISCNT